MQGSLENPPIMVRESWSWRILLPVAMAGFTVLGLLPHGATSNQPIVTVSLLALGWAVCLLHLLRRPRLEIWPDKLVWRDFLGIRHTYAFADIEEFKVYYGGKSGMQVAFTWREDSPRRTGLSRISELLDGADVLLGGSWEMPIPDLVDLLNRRRLLPSAWRQT